MKHVITLVFAAMLAVNGAFAAGTLPQPFSVWEKGGWNNWGEIVAKADAGELNQEGQEWIVDLARYHAGKIDATELWKRTATTLVDGDYARKYGEIGYRILLNEPAESTAAAPIRAEMDAALAGENAEAAKAARGGYARLAEKQGNYELAWEYFISSGMYANNAANVAGILLKDKANAAAVYQGVLQLFETGVDAQSARRLIPALQKAAVYAKIPAAEVRGALETVQRLYADRAIGDTDDAKAWGIVLGALRDSIAAWK